MIQVKASGTGLTLQNREGSVVVDGNTIAIGEEKFQSPGEYEANGIALLYGDQAALFEWEHLQIVAVLKLGKPTAFDREQFNSASVVLLGQSEEPLTKEILTEIISAYEPSVVIFHPQTATAPELIESLKAETLPVIKLTAATLPLEGRQTFILS
jgi:hypothetical protein